VVLAQMVELFRAASPKMLSAIRASVTDDDAAALARAAHTLSGSVGNFGPTDCFDSARELERMGRDHVLAGASGRLAVLEEQVGRLERDLAAFVATADVPI